MCRGRFSELQKQCCSAWLVMKITRVQKYTLTIIFLIKKICSSYTTLDVQNYRINVMHGCILVKIYKLWQKEVILFEAKRFKQNGLVLRGFNVVLLREKILHFYSWKEWSATLNPHKNIFWAQHHFPHVFNSIRKSFCCIHEFEQNSEAKPEFHI